MTIKIYMSGLKDKLKKASKVTDAVIKPAFRYFILATPIKTGYARSHTRLKKNVIKAKYPYASNLDAGSSKQSPKGMVEPTLKEIERLVNDYIKKIGRKK